MFNSSEIKRLPYCLNKSITSGSINHIPEKFTLGKGHLLFFLNKLGFIRNRLNELHEECIRRGFSVTCFDQNFTNVPSEYLNGYSVTKEEEEILRKRITERIINGKKKTWHYYGK